MDCSCPYLSYAGRGLGGPGGPLLVCCCGKEPNGQSLDVPNVQGLRKYPGFPKDSKGKDPGI